MDASDDGWPLRLRVHGGRLDHMARRRTVGTSGRMSPWVDLACGKWVFQGELDNRLCGKPCGPCARAAARRVDPWARNAEKAAVLGLVPLW